MKTLHGPTTIASGGRPPATHLGAFDDGVKTKISGAQVSRRLTSEGFPYDDDGNTR